MNWWARASLFSLLFGAFGVVSLPPGWFPESGGGTYFRSLFLPPFAALAGQPEKKRKNIIECMYDSTILWYFYNHYVEYLLTHNIIIVTALF